MEGTEPMHARARPHYTEAEYLALEDASDRKHEFIDGEIIAMAGGSARHNAISLNVGGALTARLKGRPCRAFSSDQRVATAAGGDYVYPDIVVGCPPFDLDGATLRNPRLVVEVTSPSTRQHDQSTKLRIYQSIASVTDVLLVEQDTQRVEHHRRVGAETWMMQPVTEGAVTLTGLEVELPLDEIYADLDGLPTG